MELTRVLLEYGADATTQNNEGATPMDLASERGHVELEHVLRDAEVRQELI